MTEEILELLDVYKLLSKLPPEIQTEIKYMIKGAALVAASEER